MSFNIDEIDMSKFICLKLPDNSYYYGEISYINKDGEIV